MRGGKLGGTRERMFTNLVQHFGGYKVGWMVREKGRGKRSWVQSPLLTKLAF